MTHIPWEKFGSNNLPEVAKHLVSAGLCPEGANCLEILEGIERLGYTLTKKKTEETQQSDDYLLLKNQLQEELLSSSIGRLHEYYLQRNKRIWRHNQDLFLLIGNEILQQGEPLLAYDVFSSGLKTFGENIPLDLRDEKKHTVAVALIHGKAKALTQSGALTQARDLLELLIGHDITDSETMGLLGRVYKDMAFSEGSQQKQFLEKAFTLYFTAYQKASANDDLDSARYNGINAAALSFFSDKKEQSLKLASEVEKLCLRIREQQGDNADSFWIDATLGEAFLLQGEYSRAWQLYRKACEKTGRDLLRLSSIILQARRIMAHGKVKINIAPGPCALPSVIVFSGHMVDTADREIPRFPASREKEVAFKISLEIDRLKGRIGYATAAAGGDILFLEAMAERGGEIHIILPVNVDDYKRQSVSPAGHDWEQRFDAIIERADSLAILDEFSPHNYENSLEFTNTYLFGISKIRAEQIGSTLHPLALLAPNSPAGKGGTASMVRLWQRQEVEYSLITLIATGYQASWASHKKKKVKLQTLAELSAPSCTCAAKAKHHAFLPMLFADVKGYSQLSENEAICFSGTFLSRMAKVLEKYEVSILSKRTVGDGLFVVFYGLQPAIQIARNLQEMISKHNWQDDGLPADIQMRISLDAGPCYSYTDPVMDKLEFCGNYVVRAARMEPITPPGQIYASDTFVALSRAEGLGQGSFSYAGKVILPKNYGTLSVYHVNLL
jgi:tetratricopeptide (TPR) repeat protein